MTKSQVLSYATALFQGLKPDPLQTVAQWADTHRVLSSMASGEPGQWRTSRTPYLREIMDCLSPSSPVERVVFMAGAQIGKTEGGLNWLGYVIHQAPGPMLMVQPTVEMGKRVSKQRIDPLVESSKVLSTLVKDPRSRDSGNTIMSKEFPGGILVVTGANSAVGLRSMPVRYLFMDEIDGYPGDADGEGDPVALAIQRTVTFANRKILMVSTPTTKGFSRIETAYNESDMRRFWVPCPHCQEMQVLEWSQVRWPEGEREKAYYKCIHCKGEIQDYQKSTMLARGEWRAGKPGKGKIAGFHLSSLYSPHGWTSWGDIAVEHGEVYRDPFRLKVWVNTKLGETWEDEAEKIDGEGLMTRREDFGATLPAGIAVLTAGIDVQGDRLEVEIVGWGRDEESWAVDYRVLSGDPSGLQVWRDLDDLLKNPFPHARAIPDLTIKAAAIDTGGHHTLQSYAFCRTRQERRVWAIKGIGGMGKPVWPARSSRNNKGRVPLFIVGVDAAKEAIYSRLRLREAGPGFCHFPKDRDVEWFQQLTAESIETKYNKGRPTRVWIKKSHDRNEALDCRVYAMAALQGLKAAGFMLNRESNRVMECPLKGVIGAATPVKRQAQKCRVIKSDWM